MKKMYNTKDETTRRYVKRLAAFYRSLRGHHFAHIAAFYAAQVEG